VLPRPLRALQRIDREFKEPHMAMGSRAFTVSMVLIGTLLAVSAPPRAAAQAATSGAAATNPVQVVASAPRGSLKNPYTGQEDKIAQGHELFNSYGCSGCHGGTGGGGMCPPINGDVWFYGMADDTLFRLIVLGSTDLQKAGFDRLGGPGLIMPPFGQIIKTDDDLWKIIAWIRSIYTGDPKKKFW
jgi:mono/diheme cytochrome c family protein